MIRYYSNAFTDMVKQDAMNVFLGCYIPTEMSVHLWDLDSDYYLHNRSYRPPTPHTNRILHEVNLLTAKKEKGEGKEEKSGYLDGLTCGADSRVIAEDVLGEKIAKRYFIKCGTNRQEDAGCMQTIAGESALRGFHRVQNVTGSSSSLAVGEGGGEKQGEGRVGHDGVDLRLESGISMRG